MPQLKTNNAYDLQREIGALPDVSVIFITANPMLHGESDDDVVEVYVGDASEASKATIRELAGKGWTIEKNGEYWRLHSDYYPHPAEEMTQPKHNEAA